MLRVTHAQVVGALQAVGVKQGEGLMVHASTQLLGFPEGGVEMYYNALSEVLGLGMGLVHSYYLHSILPSPEVNHSIRKVLPRSMWERLPNICARDRRRTGRCIPCIR